jgi:hypothetical protein
VFQKSQRRVPNEQCLVWAVFGNLEFLNIIKVPGFEFGIIKRSSSRQKAYRYFPPKIMY